MRINWPVIHLDMLIGICIVLIICITVAVHDKVVQAQTQKENCELMYQKAKELANKAPTANWTTHQTVDATLSTAYATLYLACRERNK